MKRSRAIAPVAITLMIALSLFAPAQAKGVAEAVDYVKAQQSADGGFAEPGASADVLTTCWAMLAGSAAGQDVLAWSKDAEGPIEFLESQASEVQRLGDIEICALALASCGGDPEDFAGRNLLAIIKAAQKDDGSIGETVADTCWGMIALRAAGQELSAKTVTWLLERQRADGGWGESEKVVVSDTALAVQALIGAQGADKSVTDPAMKLLREKIGPDGGYAEGGSPTNTELTSMVVCAISAVGQDPSSAAWTFQGSNPKEFLDSMQAADGHFQYSKGRESQPTVMTSMAIPATGGKYFPLSSESLTSDGGAAIHDLGTTGAGLSPGTGPSVPARAGKQNTASVKSTGQASSTSGAGGLWLFLLICGAYGLALLIAAVTAAVLYVPKD